MNKQVKTISSILETEEILIETESELDLLKPICKITLSDVTGNNLVTSSFNISPDGL